MNKNSKISASLKAPIFDGWDADVILHSEKLAVLWNGRWHYEQVTAQHSVKQVQNRDALKSKAIERMGIKYCRQGYGSV